MSMLFSRSLVDPSGHLVDIHDGSEASLAAEVQKRLGDGWSEPSPEFFDKTIAKYLKGDPPNSKAAAAFRALKKELFPGALDPDDLEAAHLAAQAALAAVKAAPEGAGVLDVVAAADEAAAAVLDAADAADEVV